ncbi:MAG: hypothetical protein ACKOOL_02365 [Novosphingobium sp.]
MFKRNSRIAAALAVSAVASLAATPAAAQGWGWGGGWGGHHHRDRIDAGDVIAGVLIIGGIAAIASAASKGKRDRRDDDRRGDYPREDQRGYYGNDGGQQWQQNGSVDSAVNRCSNEVSRGSGRNVDVQSINRDGDGWRIEGRTGDGANFTCAIDGSGQIRNVQVDGRAY